MYRVFRPNRVLAAAPLGVSGHLDDQSQVACPVSGRRGCGTQKSLRQILGRVSHLAQHAECNAPPWGYATAQVPRSTRALPFTSHQSLCGR
jgi:hypothetical protein